MSKKDWRELQEYRAMGKPGQLRPFKQAEWEFIGGDKWRCTGCGVSAKPEPCDGVPTFTFCPHCGAEMIGATVWPKEECSQKQ